MTAFYASSARVCHLPPGRFAPESSHLDPPRWSMVTDAGDEISILVLPGTACTPGVVQIIVSPALAETGLAELTDAESAQVALWLALASRWLARGGRP
jgi:hypothetical protein